MNLFYCSKSIILVAASLFVVNQLSKSNLLLRLRSNSNSTTTTAKSIAPTDFLAKLVQRTLTVGGRITVPTAGLQFNKNGNDKWSKYFVLCSVAVESNLVKLETSFRYSDTSPNCECSLADIIPIGVAQWSFEEAAILPLHRTLWQVPLVQDSQFRSDGKPLERYFRR